MFTVYTRDDLVDPGVAVVAQVSVVTPSALNVAVAKFVKPAPAVKLEADMSASKELTAARPVAFKFHVESVTALTAATEIIRANALNANKANVLFFMCNHSAVTAVYKYFGFLKYSFQTSFIYCLLHGK